MMGIEFLLLSFILSTVSFSISLPNYVPISLTYYLYKLVSEIIHPHILTWVHGAVGRNRLSMNIYTVYKTNTYIAYPVSHLNLPRSTVAPWQFLHNSSPICWNCKGIPWHQIQAGEISDTSFPLFHVSSNKECKHETRRYRVSTQCKSLRLR